jgi:hypothetical protein
MKITNWEFSQYVIVAFHLSEWMNYDRRSVGQSVLVSSPIWGWRPDINYYLTITVLSMSGAPSDERSGLSFVLVAWTASVQFNKFAAGPRQHSVYLSVFITPGERVAQLHPQALASSGTSGVPFPVPTIGIPTPALLLSVTVIRHNSCPL